MIFFSFRFKFALNPSRRSPRSTVATSICASTFCVYKMRLLRYLSLVGICSAAYLPLKEREELSWTYQGCFVDDVNKRTLAHASNRNYDVQTVDTCTSYCATNGFAWAGLEYGSECYCDYRLPREAMKQPDIDCSMSCAGNVAETCGNANRLSIYSRSGESEGPSINPGPAEWTFAACYIDSANARTLKTSQNVNGGASGMSVSQCTSACAVNGYSLAGLEYGSECYCDNRIRNAATIAESGCDMLCAGNSSEFCGGSNRVQLYRSTSAAPPPAAGSPSGWKSLGCFTDDGGARTLGTQQEVLGGYLNMTVEGCLSACSSLGYSLSGLEYAQECFCGSEIMNGGACASDKYTCYMPCKGNTAETCGGPDRLSVYYAGDDTDVEACSASESFSSSEPPTSSTSSGTSSSTSSTVSSSSSTDTPSTTSTLTTTEAFPDPTPSSTFPACPTHTSTACPSFWSTIVADLAPPMRDAAGQCTDLARAAIRFAFHDAATFSSKLPYYEPAAGGADGSLLLSATEILRPDNNGLRDYHATLLAKFRDYRQAGLCVSAADLIQVAGSLGVLACPGGRVGRVLVNRIDTFVTAPDGLLPQAFGPGSDHDTLFALFADKGFSARDLAALIGAHSTSRANFETENGISVGASQDSTPGVWDVGYYAETYDPPDGVASFDSDVHLSNVSTTVGRQFRSFVGAQAAWGASFSSAWQAMSTLGIPRTVRFGLGDCTALVASAFPP